MFYSNRINGRGGAKGFKNSLEGFERKKLKEIQFF